MPKLRKNNPKTTKTRKSKNLGGRPTKLTKLMIQKICMVIKKGSSIKTACIINNISTTTYHDWIKQGKADKKNKIKSMFSEFSDKISIAKEQYIDYLVKTIYKECKTNGRLALEVLSRKRPKEWGTVNKIKIETDDNPMLDSINEAIDLYKKGIKNEE